MYEYHDLEYLKRELKTDLNVGLSSNEAEERLSKCGLNELEKKKRKSIFFTFISQFKNPMIYILLVAISISFFLKEYSDSIVIVIVVLFNALIGMIQEIKTENSLLALEKLSVSKCVVIRDGKKHLIDTTHLVVGDLVCLEAGVSVGADLRLVECVDLKIDESPLTGESKPVSKHVDVIENNVTNLADKTNLAYMSTMVSMGKGKGVVISTGMDSQIGKIAKMLKDSKVEESPLQKKLASLGKLLGIIIVVVCVLLFLVALIEKRDVLEMVINSISLAVAAIPEGLPAVVTIVLALGVQKMSKVNAMVKKLPSVETLGMVNVVCSDKTGTITQNKLTCAGILDGDQYQEKAELKNIELIRCATLCNNAFLDGNAYRGNVLECELKKIVSETKIEIIDYKRVEEKEFNSSRKMMSTLNVVDGKLVQYTKGAYDKILPICEHINIGGVKQKITPLITRKIDLIFEKLASEGKRIIAFSNKENVNRIEEKNMTFLGFFAFFDPPRPKVKESVDVLKSAGITPVMITGDHLNTAYSIAKETGITDDYNACITGDQLEQLSDDKLAAIIEEKRVFARVTPLHKTRVVEAFKCKGNVVAMTGDGVNDAPSLKSANVGISMGVNGSDVAKEASDVILMDDDFSTIELAIKEGRIIYENIKKTILFLLSSNLAEIIVMVFAIVLGLPMPLVATHILLVNLLTDSLPALGLGVDRGISDIMKQKPRHVEEGLFANGGLKRLLIYAFAIAMVSLISFFIPAMAEIYKMGVPFKFLKNVLLNESILNKCQTATFIALSVSELFYAFIVKGEGENRIKTLFSNRWLNFSFLIGVFMIAIFIFSPLSGFLRMYPLTTFEFIGVIIITFMLMIVKSVVDFRFHMKQRTCKKVKQK